LSRALLDVGQAVPLLWWREQALAEEREPVGKDGQLVGLRIAECAINSDEVAEVELLGQLPTLVADLLLAEEDLDLAGPVAKLEEMNFPLPAPQYDPARHPHARARLFRAGRCRVEGAHFGD